ncbi:MAG: indolepyruvate oxidoreductase subunit beta [Phycisphaerae bacterium]
MSKKVINVVFAGLGGQGVLKSSDILSAAAFEAGLDVKKAEVHGMSQRGGSVTSDVRFGEDVQSPMVPAGEADFLVVLEETQVEINRSVLSDDGVLISCEIIDENALPNARSLNVALLGTLSTYLDIDEKHWHAAIGANLPAKVHEANFEAFELGKKAAADN